MCDKQLIIGLGSGRCGTTSLARLLNKQEDAKVTHEAVPVLYWKFYDLDADKRLNYLLNQKYSIVGDVGFYYLNYVEYMAEKMPSIKFVCLKRDKEETVRSFIRKVGIKNHWSSEYGKPDAKWDPTFPNINAPTLEENVSRYWDLYYKKASELEESIDNFAIFPIEAMNNEEGVISILDFCEIENPVIETEIKSNAARSVLGKFQRQHNTMFRKKANR